MSATKIQTLVFVTLLLILPASAQTTGDLVLDGDNDPSATLPGGIDLNGDININNNRIINLADPTNPQEAATMSYVDSTEQDDQTLAEVLAQGNSAGANSINMNGNDINDLVFLNFDQGASINDDSSGDLIFNNAGLKQVNSLQFSGGEQITAGSRLQLESDSGYVDLRSSDSTHGLILRDFDGSSTNWGGIRMVNSDRLEFRVDGTSYSHFVLKEGHRVGIATNNPSNRLDINVGSSYSHGISLDGQTAISARNGNEWLRLNQDSHFSNGIYTPGQLRVDGRLDASRGSFRVPVGTDAW